MRLLLGADEENLATAGGEIGHEVVSVFELRHRLLEIDDVDAVALGEDIGLHLRVPALGLVTEVNARLKQRPEARLGRHAQRALNHNVLRMN